MLSQSPLPTSSPKSVSELNDGESKAHPRDGEVAGQDQPFFLSEEQLAAIRRHPRRAKMSEAVQVRLEVLKLLLEDRRPPAGQVTHMQPPNGKSPDDVLIERVNRIANAIQGAGVAISESPGKINS